MPSKIILSSILHGDLIFSWANSIINVEICRISPHSVVISGHDNLSQAYSEFMNVTIIYVYITSIPTFIYILIYCCMPWDWLREDYSNIVL